MSNQDEEAPGLTIEAVISRIKQMIVDNESLGIDGMAMVRRKEAELHVQNLMIFLPQNAPMFEIWSQKSQQKFYIDGATK